MRVTLKDLLRAGEQDFGAAHPAHAGHVEGVLWWAHEHPHRRLIPHMRVTLKVHERQLGRLLRGPPAAGIASIRGQAGRQAAVTATSCRQHGFGCRGYRNHLPAISRQKISGSSQTYTLISTK